MGAENGQVSDGSDTEVVRSDVDSDAVTSADEAVTDPSAEDA